MTEDFLPFYRKAKFWRFVAIWGPFIVFLFFLFGEEFWLVVNYLSARFANRSPQNIVPTGFDYTVIYAGSKILTNISIFCGVYFISLFIVAQFILPVHTLR